MKHKLLYYKNKLKVKDWEELTRDDILGKSNKQKIVARYQPLYNPCGPSFLITLRKQSKLLAYSLSWANTARWFCILVLTRSIGYTAVAPAAGGYNNTAKSYFHIEVHALTAKWVSLFLNRKSQCSPDVDFSFHYQHFITGRTDGQGETKLGFLLARR